VILSVSTLTLLVSHNVDIRDTLIIVSIIFWIERVKICQLVFKQTFETFIKVAYLHLLVLVQIVIIIIVSMGKVTVRLKLRFALMRTKFELVRLRVDVHVFVELALRTTLSVGSSWSMPKSFSDALKRCKNDSVVLFARIVISV
jgi:hypothetical protein